MPASSTHSTCVDTHPNSAILSNTPSMLASTGWQVSLWSMLFRNCERQKFISLTCTLSSVVHKTSCTVVTSADETIVGHTPTKIQSPKYFVNSACTWTQSLNICRANCWLAVTPHHSLEATTGGVCFIDTSKYLCLSTSEHASSNR